jgi:uracil-DNA glycosylase
VCLGATAAKAILGAGFRITESRGRLQRPEGLPPVLATFHPSYLLRLKGRPGEEEARSAFVGDLAKAARLVQEKSDS